MPRLASSLGHVATDHAVSEPAVPLAVLPLDPDLLDVPAHDAAVITQTRAALGRIFTIPGKPFADRLQLARQMNGQLRAIEFRHGLSRLGSRPHLVELPVAGRCNLRCTMCGLSHGDPGYPNWTLEQVQRFEPFFRYARSVNPTGAGEPLTVKDFFSMLELFTSYGLGIGFYSNATLLNADRVERLLRLGINQLNVSLDGATAETFERIRHHAKFDVVIANLRHFITRRRELGLKKPALQIAMVLMQENMHELPDVVRLAASLEAGSVYVGFVSDLVPAQMCERDPVRTNAMLREARRAAKETGLRILCPDYLPEDAVDASGARPEFTRPAPATTQCACTHPWNQFVVWGDGAASPCCRLRDAVDGHTFGNAFEEDPQKLWNSDGMVYLRQRLAAGDPPESCRNCPIRTSALH